MVAHARKIKSDTDVLPGDQTVNASAKSSSSDLGLASTIGQNLSVDVAKTAATSKASAAKSMQRRQTAKMQRLVEPAAAPAHKAPRVRGSDGRFSAKVAAQSAQRGIMNTAARVMTPLAIAGGISNGVTAFNDAKANGQTTAEASMAAAKASAPTAIGLSAGAALAKLAPGLARVAGPIGLAATLGAAAYKGIQGYKSGGIKGAALGAADSLSFGLASKAVNAITGGDKTTMAIAQQSGQMHLDANGQQMEPGEGMMGRAVRHREKALESIDRSEASGINAARSFGDAASAAAKGQLPTAVQKTRQGYNDAKEGVDFRRQAKDYTWKAEGESRLAKKAGFGNTLGIPGLNGSSNFAPNNGDMRRFHEADQHFAASHMQDGAQSQMPAQPESPGKHRGWSPAARIAAAKARGLEKLPYGGDPGQAPDADTWGQGKAAKQ